MVARLSRGPRPWLVPPRPALTPTRWHGHHPGHVRGRRTIGSCPGTRVRVDDYFVTVQQESCHREIVHVGRCHRVDEVAVRIGIVVRFHAEERFVPLPGLVHLSVRFVRPVLRRTRGRDDRQINLGALAGHRATLLLQCSAVHCSSVARAWLSRRWRMRPECR